LQAIAHFLTPTGIFSFIMILMAAVVVFGCVLLLFPLKAHRRDDPGEQFVKSMIT